MACRLRKMRQKHEQEMNFCNCMVAIFQVMVACQSITFISGQGYLYPNAELQSRRLLEGVSVFPRHQPQGVTSEKVDKKLYSTSHSTLQIKLIRFEPPYLDFDAECVGMPKLRTVFIHNPSKERDLQLNSISARTSHFHSSFFDRKIVPPGGNTSFEVVFLARIIGNVENTLFINTVHGTFPYQVFGIGIPNPYRLRPYLGAKVPINSSFSPLISMHNPTSQPLQVTEMYSSSGFLQLQLPSGEHQVEKAQWEIPPYETKHVMQANFLGQVEANHTAFIRIKTSQTENSVFHILPVEVEVSSAPGIYSSIELLDFGTIRTQYDDPKMVPLFLLNSGDREVVLNSITLSHPNPAINIDFKPVKLRPSESTFTRVANITFSALLAKSEEHQTGSITVKTKEKSYPTVEIPFTANLLDGTLGYDEANTLFNEHDVKSEKKITRRISLSNLFPFPVILQNVTLTKDASQLFTVVDFEGPVTLPPYSQNSPFSVEYNPKGGGNEGENPGGIETGSIYYLILQTNASKFSLPLHTYSGMLHYKVQQSDDNKKIDFGIMGTGDKRQVLFAVYNHNPTPVTLNVINSSLLNTSVRFVSLTQGFDKNLTSDANFELENFELPTNSCSVFEVTLTASDVEDDIVGTVNLYTKYQKIRIPVIAKVIVGTLTVKPERIKLAASFPGAIVRQSVSITNTFAQSTSLESVRFLEGDKRFYYRKIKNQQPTFEPNNKVKVGKVYFDPRQICKPDRCYLGLPTSTTVGHHWLTTLALGPDCSDFDFKRYREFKQRWENLKSEGLTRPNTTLVLDTTVARNMQVPVQAVLIWPRLLQESEYNFPLTHVGKFALVELTIVNPADSPVIVQILPLSNYPQPETALKALGLAEELGPDRSIITNNASIFQLYDSPLYEDAKETTSSNLVWLEYTLNGKLNHSAMNLFLDSGQRVRFKVQFVPYDDTPKTTVILLRNNLTILDTIVVHGRGAREHLMLGGKSPNLPNSILRFKITRDILKDCTRTKKKLGPNFTVRKWFHANNTGLLPIHITSITVNGSPCEGYGFRVLDCDQFILQPGASKKIEIAFTPDFTSYLVLHKLKLVTAQGNDMIFTLNVTLPPYMLPLCQEAVPRPSWEPALFRFIATVMVVLFFGILLMSYLEAINIWEPFVRLYEVELQHRQEAGGKRAPDGFQKRFDLRNIATSFISTVTSNQKQTKSETTSSKKKRANLPDPKSPFTDFSCVGYVAGNKRNFSLQTDPDPEFPPLPRTGKHHNTRTDSTYSYNSLRQRNVFKKDEPMKILKKNVDAEGNKTMEELPPEVAEKFLPYMKLLSEKDTKCKMDDKSVGTDPKYFSSPKKVSPEPKLPLEREKMPENVLKDVVPAQKVERQSKTYEKSSCAKANRRQSTISSSSSCSADTQENDSNETKSTETNEEKSRAEKENTPLKMEKESKQLREKKPRKGKLTRKQLKAAIAKEREDSLKADKEESKEKKASVVSEDEKVSLDSNKRISKKQMRLMKREAKRSLSTSSEVPSVKNLQNETSKARKDNGTQDKLLEKFSKPTPKRRTVSSGDSSKPKDLSTPKYTIYKKPRVSDSGSSSPQESSSSESAPLWDTPIPGRDQNEEMAQLSKQTRQAGFLLGGKKKPDGKRNKDAPSPVNLSSSSRSSSYSSMVSSASSNEGATKNHSSGTPTKRLSRSASDTTGRSTPRTHMRKRNPYSPVSPEMVSVSPTHSNGAQNQDYTPYMGRSSPKSPQEGVQTNRTHSTPSMFTNSFGNKSQDQASFQQNQSNWTSYSAFGNTSFNFMENIMGGSQPSQESVTWCGAGTPFSDNSSFYSTPSPQKNGCNRGSPQQGVRHWSSSGSPLSSPTGYSAFDAPPGTPTTPGLPMQLQNNERSSLGWSEVPRTGQATNMSTHSIWSVSNAVTMDENRNTDECDPLGLKSIWSNSQRGSGWQERM